MKGSLNLMDRIIGILYGFYNYQEEDENILYIYSFNLSFGKENSRI